MAGAKEIRSKIASIKSTQKITSAMEKVAVSKMRKAQMRMAASRPYAERIRQVIGHLANANPEYRHPFMIERAVKVRRLYRGEQRPWSVRRLEHQPRSRPWSRTWRPIANAASKSTCA